MKKHLVGSVVAVEEIMQTLCCKTFYIAFGAKYVMRQRVTTKNKFLEIVVDQFRRRVFVGIQFLEHNILFFFNLLGRKSGMENDIGKEFQTAFQMDRKRRCIYASFLLGGESVELASHSIDAVKNMICPTMFGALKNGMLNEVRHTLIARLLVARTNIDIDTSMCDSRIILPAYNL